MTSSEIDACPQAPIYLGMETTEEAFQLNNIGYWLREIAHQLAILNEQKIGAK